MSVTKISFKFAWERALGMTRYVASVKQVARVLSGYAHLDGSNARPGVDRIMAECSLKRSAVLAAIRVLIEDGWIVKAPRIGVKRDFFDTYQLVMPAWLDSAEPERPDVRREAEREAVAERMREERRARAAADRVQMYGPNQIQTYGPDVEINWGDHTEVSGPYADPDQVHTPGRPGPYAVEEAAGQTAPRITNRTTLKNNHGAPIVAGAPRAPLAAGPLVPHGVDLAIARSEREDVPEAESKASSPAPRKPRKPKAGEPFRNESNLYIAAAKKLDWDTIKDALRKWKDARGGEYDWARGIGLSRMGNGAKHGLKTSRGFERADRLTLEAALRMHLDDGSWHEALLAPLGVPEIVVAPLETRDLDDVRRRAELKSFFETIRRMDFDAVKEFGLRVQAQAPDVFKTAVALARADMEIRQDFSSPDRRNRLLAMQVMNITTDWPAWLTDALQLQPRNPA